MATKKDLVADMRRQYGNMLSVSNLARYFGVDRKTVRKWLDEADPPLDYYPVGERKLYAAMDIAKRLEAIKNT